LILILRDPVHRAVSAYYHHIWRRRIPPRTPLSEAADRYGILSMGFYHDHLTEWLKHFDLDRYLILCFEEDIVRNPERTLERVFRFLEVDDGFRSLKADRKFNRKFGDAYLYMNYYLPGPTRLLTALFPEMKYSNVMRIDIADEELTELTRVYRSSTDQLEFMLGREFPWRR